MRRRYWIKSALKVSHRRRGLHATGYTPKLHHHRRHIKSVRVEALHKGALHRWAGKPVTHKFTAHELDALEKRARNDHDSAVSLRERQSALRHLRMVLFARRARKFSRHGQR